MFILFKVMCCIYTCIGYHTLSCLISYIYTLNSPQASGPFIDVLALSHIKCFYTVKA